MKKSLCLLPLLLLSFNSEAHRSWIAPNATVLDAKQPKVSFDAGVSDTLFIADHMPIRGAEFNVIAPNGELLAPAHYLEAEQRTSFDLQLQQAGTYRIGSFSAGLSARWEDENGKRQFWPARGEKAKPEEFASKVPKQAKNLSVSYNSRRIETFVTSGVPDQGALTPAKEGLELVPISHPNELFAGETARFRFLLDGQPVAGAEVQLQREGNRYRNNPEDIHLSTDANGEISITWQGAGRYFLGVNYKDKQAPAPASERSASYSAVLEVFPD